MRSFLGDEVFRDLVIARVVEPTSLLDAGRVLRDLGRTPASYATMKRTLGRAATAKYRDRIASWCFQHVSTSGDVHRPARTRSDGSYALRNSSERVQCSDLRLWFWL